FCHAPTRGSQCEILRKVPRYIPLFKRGKRLNRKLFLRWNTQLIAILKSPSSQHCEGFALHLKKGAREARHQRVKRRFGRSAYRVAKRGAAGIQKALEEGLLLLVRSMLHRNSHAHRLAHGRDVVFGLTDVRAPADSPARKLLAHLDEGVVRR